MREWWSKLCTVFRRKQLADDLREEAEAHLQMEVEANMERGMTPDDAINAARRNFGNQMLIQESAQESWAFRSLENLLQDVQYGLRMVRRSPGFAAAVTLCLALGIGANTAIFTLIEVALLRILPVREPAELVQVVHTGTEVAAESESSESTNYDLFRHLRDHHQSLAGLFLVDPGRGKAVVDGVAELVQLQEVTGDYYTILGVGAVIGRTIVRDDSSDSGFRPVAVLGYDYWQRRFGGDPGALGRVIHIEGVAYTVVGVTPRSFFGLQRSRGADITVPMNGAKQEPGWYSMAIVGRLRSGVSATQARTELDGLFQQYLRGLAQPERVRAASFARLDLVPASRGFAGLRRRFSRPLLALMAMVSLVLVVACANVAILLLARATIRRRELAVRMALGAGRGRINRQLLTEGILLSFFGGAAGLILAWKGTQALASLTVDEGLTRTLSAPPNAVVLGFTLAVSAFVGILFSLAPVLRAQAMAPAESLAGGRAVVGGRSAVGKTLVVLQLAVSVVLLAGAGLFVRSLNNLKGVELGADGRVLEFAVDMDGYKEGRLPALQMELLQRLESLPGVRHAALTTIPPLSGNEDGKPVAVPGYEVREGESIVAQVNGVTGEYFATFGVPILTGRSLAESDSRNSAKVVVISESLARHYFGTVNPVGKRLGFGRLRNQAAGQAEIVGVARDALYRRSLREAPPDMIYVPYSQMNESADTVDFGLRVDGDPEALASAARRTVQALVPTALVAQPRTLAQQVDEILVLERLLAALGGAFGILCLALTAVGLYGLLAYSVARRTAEIGLRIALGAERGRILWLVLRESMVLFVAGTAAGLAVAFIVLKPAAGLLFGVNPADLTSLAGAIGLLAAVTLAASAVLGMRAARVDPNTALRYE
jgi:predicted permease